MTITTPDNPEIKTTNGNDISFPPFLAYPLKYIIGSLHQVC
jgi:hypothetical protein